MIYCHKRLPIPTAVSAMTEPIDRLVCAVVHNDDANAVNEALIRGEYRATRINAHGGFLRHGNAIFLTGVPAAAVDEVRALIRGSCTHAAGEGPGGSVYGIQFVIRLASTVRV